MRLGIERLLIWACGKLGHLLANVEEGHARCRICRTHFFCAHASHEQIGRYLLGANWPSSATSNVQNVTVTYTPRKKGGDQC